MKATCRFCGAAVDTSMKLCPGCGKILPTYYKPDKEEKQQFDTSSGGGERVQQTSVKTSYAATRSARQMSAPEELGGKKKGPPEGYDPRSAAAQHRVPFQSNPSSGKEYGSRISPFLGKFFKILIVVVILLLLYAVGKVMLVRQAGYDFKLDKDIKLESRNYGDAFSKYFEDGKWWFDFKTNTVTYKGTAPDGSEYEMIFGKEDGQTVVKTLYVDGRKISAKDNNIMKNYILGAFMATKERRSGPTAMGQVDINKV